MTIVASKALSFVNSTSLQQSQPTTNDIRKQQQHLRTTLTAQEKEKNMTMLEPNQVEEYLLAGQWYEAQKRYSKARTIYADSLAKIPFNDPHHCELRRSLKNVNMRLGAFIYLFPYHVLCIIFDHLSRYSLITCLDVCESWNHFILQWPGFWDTHRHEHYYIDRTMANSFLDDKNDHLYIRSPVSNTLLGPILKFVVATRSWRYKHLEFEDMPLNKKHIDLILKAVQSHHSIAESLSFKDFNHGSQVYILRDILGQCPQLRHFTYHVGIERPSFEMRMGYPCKLDISFLKQHMVRYFFKGRILDKIPHGVYKLTTLDLSMDVRRYRIDPADPVKAMEPLILLPYFIKRCPHLERLRIDSFDHIHHGHVIRTAIKHCHRLKDLIVSGSCEIPDSVVNRYDTIKGSKTNGLQRFVLSAHYWSRVLACTSDMMAVVKRYHTSLSVLYLRFDTELIDICFLFRLAHYRLPQLLELHLSAEGFRLTNDQKRTRMDSLRPSFNKAIATLSPRCPNLRILHIVEQFYCKSSFPVGLFSLEDNVILSLVDHCRFLDRLEIDTSERYIVQENLTAIDFEEFKNMVAKS